MKVHFSSNIKDNIFPLIVLNSDSQRANPHSLLGQESMYCLSAPNRTEFKKIVFAYLNFFLNFILN